MFVICMPKPRILLLAADGLLWDSLAGLLRLDGADVVASAPSEPGGIDLVVVASDSWPKAWPARSLRALFRGTPCLLLSGSPVSGPYTASTFPRGFFAQLPVTGAQLADLVRSLLA